MNDCAAVAIIVIICVGMLFLIALIGVTIAETIQDMKRKKEEWKRQDILRGWRKHDADND